LDQEEQDHAVIPTVVLHFLQRTFPFSELPTSLLDRLSRRCVIDHYPKGSLIFHQDTTEVTHFHIIQKGAVKAYLTSEDTLVSITDYSGEGESFGALPIVSGQHADFNVEAVEDTFCFLIQREDFLDVVKDNPRFARYYLETFSEDFVCAVYSELRREKLAERRQDTFYLLNHRVRDIIKQTPDIIESSMSVQDAGAHMAKLRVDALLVRDKAGALVGLLSNKDFRTKVVAEALDYSTPVAQIMTAPLPTIPAQALCFDALMRMIRDRVDQLAVEHRKTIVGLVSAHDIVLHQGASFLYDFWNIGAQQKLAGLQAIPQKVPVVVRTLMQEGARAENLTKVITLFNDRILKQLLTLVSEELGPSPVPFCWMTLGSEGRREQTFKRDQDNALIYQEPADPKDRPDVEAYFRTFAKKAVDHLHTCGYERCLHKFMASNPRWCRPYEAWESYFEEWILHPIPPEVALFKIFFDFRPLYGSESIATHLRTRIVQMLPRGHAFLRYLAEDYLNHPPPISLFGEFIVDPGGAHVDQMDLKSRGLTPFVNFARLMALRHGIRETGTLERLQLLCERGHLPRELYSDAREAYEFQIQLTLVQQLRSVEEGLKAEYYLRPSELSDLERKTLKDAFAVIHRMMEHVRKVFGSAEAPRHS
jgi:CBS domain-containing protein